MVQLAEKWSAIIRRNKPWYVSVGRGRFWHRLLGFWLGAVLLLVCLTGSILLFKNPLLQWLYPQLNISLVDDPQLQGLALDSLDQRQYAFVRLPNTTRPWLELSRLDGTLEYWSVPVSAVETPRLLLSRAPYSDLLDWCYQLHLYLFVKPWKHQLLGVVGLAALLLLATGVKTQWPRNWRMLKLPLHARTLPAIQRHRQWHYVIAVLSLPLLLLVVSTGTAIAYNTQTQQLFSWVLQDPPEPAIKAEPVLPAVALTTSDWPLWLTTARQLVPDAQLRLASFRKTATDVVQMRVQLPEEWHPNGRSVIRLAPDGTVLSLQRATESAPGRQLSQLIYPLHVAAVGGTWYLWLLFGSGWLPLTLWWLGAHWRRGRLQKEKHRG
ncbi:PepSY-associated TM helix domain-containing protein [Rheinheimera sp. 4Y26]|uniref:PepSY-associated TM helix domain-containing protein n=1 Tax=Rheinheimera sp. 4Y26 TaxID=2977811 RepID=UPI0021B10078|nr:PepSY-associated TM helix domain-containing protein [Rheinheimera sp. 4Y26]MCT6700374.1 PepSY domain-containing protein [Rheinheimera sp. 4Y26]